jgi:hypothetical protein
VGVHSGLGGASPRPSPSEDNPGMEQQMQQGLLIQDNANQHQHQPSSNLHHFQQQTQHLQQQQSGLQVYTFSAQSF